MDQFLKWETDSKYTCTYTNTERRKHGWEKKFVRNVFMDSVR